MEKKALQAFLWLLALVFVGIALSPIMDTPPMDAPSFYIAGHLAATGEAHRLYDADAIAESWVELRHRGLRREVFDHDNYFIRPAVAAFFYAPLSFLPFEVAWRVFLGLSMLAAVLIVWLFPKWFQRYGDLRGWRPCMFAYLPFVWAMGLGQDTIFLALAIGGSLNLILNGRERSGGALAALVAIKPHLAWAIPLAFYFSGKRKAAAWFLAVGGAMAVVSVSVVGVEGLMNWRELVSSNQTDFFPYSMHNIRAVWIVFGAAPSIPLLVVVVGGLFYGLRSGRLETALAAALIAPPLLSPHSYTQDLALMALLPFLIAPAVASWIVFVPWMYVDPFRTDRNWPVIGLSVAWLGYTAVTEWRRRSPVVQPATQVPVIETATLVAQEE